MLTGSFLKGMLVTPVLVAIFSWHRFKLFVFFMTKYVLQDIYSCMSEDQQKVLLEKELLTRRVQEMEKEYAVQLEEIKNKTKELEHGELLRSK